MKRTLAQSEASRRNGAKSRGPVTAAGKAKSSQNGRTHGFRSAQPSIEDENDAEFQRLRKAMLEELQPAGPLESSLAEQIVHATWTLERLRDAERKVPIRQGLGSLGSLLNYARYRTSLERSRERAVKELRVLQNERALRDAPYKRDTLQLPRYASCRDYAQRIKDYDHAHGVTEPAQPTEPETPPTFPEMSRIRAAAIAAAHRAVHDLFLGGPATGAFPTGWPPTGGPPTGAPPSNGGPAAAFADGRG
jgi:hypothetical protein